MDEANRARMDSPGRPGSPSLPIIVVGAGVSGLTCAAELTRAGRSVLVLEASGCFGGRIRTNRVENYLVDRGFQVVLDAYPSLRRQIEIEDLRAQPFDAGAVIWDGKRRRVLADPLRHPSTILADLRSDVIGQRDKVRLAALAFRVRVARWESANAAARSRPGESAADVIWDDGFDLDFMEHVARPLWGGITLDPWLNGSCGPFLFTLKMLLQGRAVLPDTGIQAVPDQIAARLRWGSVRYNSPVTGLLRDGDRVTGVLVRDEPLPAAAVVVATDPPAARFLTGDARFPGPNDAVGSTTVYLKGKRDPGLGRRILLNGGDRQTVNHVAPLSSVQPSYAPNARHLIAAVSIGACADDAIAERSRAETAKMLGQQPTDWDILSVVRVPYSQFAQPPGIYRRLPGTESGTPGLVYAGEATVDSSCNGAIIAGERAARHILASTPV